METIPLRADDKGTEAGSTGRGASHRELLAPVRSETPPPGRARALGSRAGRGPPAALCPRGWLTVDGRAKSISLLVSGEKSVFLGST